MRKAKKEYSQKLIERDNNIASVWRVRNVFTKGHRSTSAEIKKNLSANVFNNHFLSVSESLIEPRTNVYEYSNPLHDFCKQKTSGQDPFVIPYISVSELGKYISRLENKKSSGLDGVSNQLLKLSLPYVIDSLTYVFNLCIEKNVFFNFFPSELKKAKVVPLPKSTDKTIPTNYRPISLLSVLSKLLEKHVHIYLNDYLEKRQLLHPFQSGFKRKYSCSTALATSHKFLANSHE